MKKLKAFLYVFGQTVTNPKYYQKILNAPFSFSLKYFLFFLFLLSLFTTGNIAYTIISKVSSIYPVLSQIKEEGKNLYPKELTVSLNNGIVTTNVKEPYSIDFPEQIPLREDEGIEHLITFDSNAQASTIPNYKSIIVIGRDTVYFQDSHQGYKFYPLSNMKGTFTMTSRIYEQWIEKLYPFFDILPALIYWGIGILLVLLPFMITFGDIIAKLLFLLLLSVPALLLASIMKRQIGYGSIYRLGMHGITIPILVCLIITLFHIRIPFLFTLIFFIWMFIVFSSLHSQKTVKKMR